MARTASVLLLAIVIGILCSCGAARPSKYYQLTIPGETRQARAVQPYQPVV